ncbi:HTH domain-containing addiction module [Thioalkalivibrio nitratireducens DSM 14787]|uniref:HTH domain-containing addiction module n=1 Tax=Thioalkalivibrio nitratireducens (strain DSM 14787 / UNIQEM 213 / ALEN2) TaxID=1255043 RepID=L0DS57_THIND|nr:DUF6364 family protein [Thioalkalivibrio nitratireducens]AGA32414.1 HTH domain-containing addiction module [Thioalkalivibrio nitratireducens DSM 14787]
MKNITLSAEERLIERARAEAARRGKSLNQLIREYLEELAGQHEPSQEFERLRELSRLSQGRRGDWRFNRNEVHERS